MGLVMGPHRPDYSSEDAQRQSEGQEHFIYSPLAEAGRCYYCAQTFEEYPIVYWHGAGAGGNDSIFLHSRCARQLGTHLIVDHGRLDEIAYQDRHGPRRR